MPSESWAGPRPPCREESGVEDWRHRLCQNQRCRVCLCPRRRGIAKPASLALQRRCIKRWLNGFSFAHPGQLPAKSSAANSGQSHLYLVPQLRIKRPCPCTETLNQECPCANG